MNFNLTEIPDRNAKPRTEGLTMVMDKGLSVEEASHFMSVGSQYVDVVKLGFGTAYVTPRLEEKLDVYRSYQIPVYFGGTLFEAFLIRDQVDDYLEVCRRYHVTYMEVSDGCINLPHADKCRYISQLSALGTVFSEVGSKDENIVMPPYKWIQLMKAELEAGASYVIAEAREAGNIGIYRGSGEVREGLVQEILTQIPKEKVLWEAPQKDQQLYFIELLGQDVNLGNIAPKEIIALETMRLGLRGDSFHLYLNQRTVFTK